MTQTVIMPKLGQTVENATLVKWHKKTGDKVKKGDILFEIETDKAMLEVESFFEGTLLKTLVGENKTVPVMSPVAFVGNPGDPIPDVAPPKAVQAQAAAPKPAPIHKQPAATADTPSPAPTAPQPAEPAAAPGRRAVSPRARALARECAISTDPINGTGPGGRVVEKDVRDYMARRDYDSIRITPAARELARKEQIDVLDVAPRAGRITVGDIKLAVSEKPRDMSPIRRAIAERLTHSYTTTPHFFVTVSVDMTDLLDLRKKLKKEGRSFSVTDFILKAVALALVRFPDVNSSAKGQSVRRHARAHLGMAVAVKDGLVVPVIRDAHEISLVELHETARKLMAKARDGNLTPDEMSGGTFTVSNMGMLNIENFTAIINPGEGAILAISSTAEKPVVFKNKIAVRSIMKMTLSSDHRIIDGATAAGFINAVKKTIEDIEQWKNMIW